MENTYKISLKARLAGGVAAVGLAACCMATPAFAVDNTGVTGNTEVTVTATDSQISWSVPTVIPFASNASGELTGPSAEATQIVNKSVFPIHATKMNVTSVDPFHVVADVDHSTETNAVQFTVNGVAAGTDVALTGAGWNMAYEGAQDSAVNLTTEGKIARVTADLSKAQKAATIEWTVAAGSAAQA